jgi:hypothetical protein
MSVHDDLAAAGRAVDALQQAVDGLGAEFGDSLDLARLREDVARICTDLELLRASRPELPAADGSPEPPAVAPPDYDPAFWADVDDEDQIANAP